MKMKSMFDERDIRIAAILKKEKIELRKSLTSFERVKNNFLKLRKLQHQLNELLRHRFGKKSERFTEEFQKAMMIMRKALLKMNQRRR